MTIDLNDDELSLIINGLEYLHSDWASTEEQAQPIKALLARLQPTEEPRR